MKKCEVDRRPPMFSTIEAAISGDTEAICTVLRHYEGYIAALSTRGFCDNFGQSYNYVDEELKYRLESKLICKIMDFVLIKV